MNIQQIYTEIRTGSSMICEKVAYEYGNQEIEQEHLLYALLTSGRQPDSQTD